VRTSRGIASFVPTRAIGLMRIDPQVQVKLLTAEQSNSSLILGNSGVLKLFRRIAPGVHPEAEMTRALTERGFANAPAFLGELVHLVGDTPHILAVLSWERRSAHSIATLRCSPRAQLESTE
jgi:maltose alpha-D-glucosyltransferase/alpha-amylase